MSPPNSRLTPSPRATTWCLPSRCRTRSSLARSPGWSAVGRAPYRVRRLRRRRIDLGEQLRLGQRIVEFQACAIVAAPRDTGGKLEIAAHQEQGRAFGRKVIAIDQGARQREVAELGRDRAARGQQLDAE